MLANKRIGFVGLVVMLCAVGLVSAADGDRDLRTPVRIDVSVEAPAVPLAGPASVTKILRTRLADTFRLLRSLRAAETEPASFGTDGLSDGPDPIDASEDGPGDTGSARKEGGGGGSTPIDGGSPDQNSQLGSR